MAAARSCGGLSLANGWDYHMLCIYHDFDDIVVDYFNAPFFDIHSNSIKGDDYMKHFQMAQKYLLALDYVDLHANSVLAKYAKKRPLGDIEIKHRYTPLQPVLSCRTVGIDISGTQTYRPKSSADIIRQQHALIHKIYTKARNVASAPPKRSKTPQYAMEDGNNNNNNENTLKSVEVHGRPLTSQSERKPCSRSARNSATNKRPKTTGTIKRPNALSDSFMIVHADRELLETRRSYKTLTDKIHKHWDPENHNLNTGAYQRGKKPPGITSVDSWLTFSGWQAEDSEGIIDAFADVNAEGEHYNVEGGVGSRIAHQLQKGDKIRIGINGNLQSHNLKVKKWTKEDSDLKLEENEDYQKNTTKNVNIIIPLSWDDQMQSTENKVLTPRGPPQDKANILLCESQPVIFTKLLPDDSSSPFISSARSKQSGYRVKQRKKVEPCVDRKEREKVTVITIDSKTEEEDKKIESLTVEEVIKLNSAGNGGGEKQNSRYEEMEKHSVSFCPAANVYENFYSHSKVSINESISSGSIEHKQLKVKPSQSTFGSKFQEVNLDISGTFSVLNGQQPLSSESNGHQGIFGSKSPLTHRSSQGQGHAVSARSYHSILRSAKAGQQKILMPTPSPIGNGINQGGRLQNEFIEISHPLKNPNPPIQQKKPADYVSPGLAHDTVWVQKTHFSVREPAPSPELQDCDRLDSGREQSHTFTPVVKPKPIIKTVAQPLSISIPTADYNDYTDSEMNSPAHRQPGTNMSQKMRRAKDMRDEQIDHITTLLIDAIIGQNDTKSAQS